MGQKGRRSSPVRTIAHRSRSTHRVSNRCSFRSFKTPARTAYLYTSGSRCVDRRSEPSLATRRIDAGNLRDALWFAGRYGPADIRRLGGGIVRCSHCSTTPAHEYRRPSIYGSATSSWTYRLWHISMGKDGRGGACRSGKRQQALFDNGSASSPGPKIPTSCFQIARAGSCHARA